MNILITGANGFIGKNLKVELQNRGYHSVFCLGRNSKKEEFEEYTKACDFVFHLAGVNRPDREEEFMEGNLDFSSLLLECLKKHGNRCPILITSSTQALLNNPYGRSKKAAESLMLSYGEKENIPVFVYRLSNVFGKWSKPDYNSAVATFCYNISRDLPIKVTDREHVITLTYIDDVVQSFIDAMEGEKNCAKDGFYYVLSAYPVKLGEIVDLLYSFKATRKNFRIPLFMNEFTKKLYSTYLSFLPKQEFSYCLRPNIDDRGSFTEFMKTDYNGQISVNISKPGITKGNHWHHTKIEKFLVVSGRGIIRFRNLFDDEIMEYKVGEEQLEVVDIPPGYTHSITNIGDTDMITIMWANECYDQKKPDTYLLEV